MNKRFIFLLGWFIFCCQNVAVYSQTNNICYLFHENPRWHYAATQSARRWGVPVSVQMAILHQESNFRSHAQPVSHFLGFIPLPQSSAYGYAQALNGTWRLYLRDTGKYAANPSDFLVASDFIGWFVSRVHADLRIPYNDTYALYLAYHEGAGGYHHKTYLRKPWLMLVARHVQKLQEEYKRQLNNC